jgi:hypothetical protein
MIHPTTAYAFYSKLMGSSCNIQAALHCEGIDDLKKGHIVTPLDPKATFLDDSLRVLRVIRFGKFKHLLVHLNLHVLGREA